MNGYFKPWRRKIGVLTLAVACAFTIAWVRSGAVVDTFYKVLGTRTECYVYSCHGSVIFILVDEDEPERNTDHYWGVMQGTVDDLQRAWNWNWDWYFAGFGWAAESAKTGALFVTALPCWSIVTPLTLLSAWLLLGKIRNPNPQPEPAPPKA